VDDSEKKDSKGWKVRMLLPGSWRGASCVLLSHGSHHFVVDTGMPHEAHLLAEAVQKCGLHPEDIRGVINTHFHVDHVLNNSLFPGSVIYAPQESYDWCRALYSDLLDSQNWEKLVLKYYPETHQYERARTHMEKLRKLALRWWDVKRLGSISQFRWVETSPLPDGLESVITSGHVPGHLSLIARDSLEPAFIAGDALLSQKDESQILTMIPVNREQFEKDREKVLQWTGLILPGHDKEFAHRGPTASRNSD
jgi:glyoxylase-like metal-dependent hydrolase (beta-lactamase superfamily II)